MRTIPIKKVISLIVLVVLISLSLTSLTLFAQGDSQAEKEGIGVSPTKLTLDADPGEQIKGQFAVINNGNVPIKYHTYVKDFNVRNEEYEKVFEPVAGAVSPVSWIEVSKDAKSLAPGAREDIAYTITVPKDAVPRGYYAVIFAETLPAEADATGVTRIKRVGSLVYLTVNGGTVEKGQVLGFDADTWQKDRPVKSSIRVKNEGNVHFEVKGNVRLKDIFGRTISQEDISGTTIPATVRKFSPELNMSRPFGLYKIEGSVSFLNDTTQLPSKWVVVGSPIWLGFAAALILAWAAVLIRWIRRRVKRNKA